MFVSNNFEIKDWVFLNRPFYFALGFSTASCSTIYSVVVVFGLAIVFDFEFVGRKRNKLCFTWIDQANFPIKTNCFVFMELNLKIMLT